MKYNLADMYTLYVAMCKTRGLEPKDYKVYKAAMYDHNETMINTLLEGGVYSFGHGMGRFGVKFCTRTFKLNKHERIQNAKVNFGATRQLRLKGDNDTVIYHTNTEFYMWMWTGANIPHQSVWTIDPTKGPIGISRKLANYVKENEGSLTKEFYMRNKMKD